MRRVTRSIRPDRARLICRGDYLISCQWERPCPNRLSYSTQDVTIRTTTRTAFPAFDAKDQYIGLDTPLDKMFHEANGQVSANPMDTTWGGRAYTQSLVDAGFYSVDEVSKSRV